MKLLTLLAIVYSGLQAAEHPYASSAPIAPLYVALVTFLMFVVGLALLAGGVYRWCSIRKRRRSLRGWQRDNRQFRNAA